MRSMTWLVIVVGLASGCSFAYSRAPSSDPGYRPVPCRSSWLPVLVDGGGAMWAGSVGIISAVAARNRESVPEAGDYAAIAIVVSALYIASIVYGARTHTRCERYQRPLPSPPPAPPPAR